MPQGKPFAAGQLTHDPPPARRCLGCLLGALAVLFFPVVGEAQSVRQWGVFEKALTSTQSYTNAQKYSAVTLNATFVGPGGVTRTVPGFWDGGTTWRIRFAPPLAGTWTYTVSSSDAQLGSSANNGSFTATAPTSADIAANPNFRGFLEVAANRRHLTYADGTPFLWMGDTAWDGNSANMTLAEMFPAYVSNRADKGFTVIQILPFADAPNYCGIRKCGVNENGALWTTLFTEINPANLQNFDRRIQTIHDAGLVPVIFGGWGGEIFNMSLTDLQHYWRYLVARYSAFNVVWSLSGEYPSGQAAKIRDLGTYIRSIDGLRHSTTIHPNWTWPGLSSSPDFHGEAWIDLHLHQTGGYSGGGINQVIQWIDNDYALAGPIPVVHSEGHYENETGTRLDVRRQAWVAWMRGAAGHTYGAYRIAWRWNEGGEWRTNIDFPGSFDMQRIVEFLSPRPWWTLRPRQDLVSSGHCLADAGREYVVYLPAGGSTTVSGLPSSLTAQWYNPATGAYAPAGSGPTFSAPSGGDWVLHITDGGSSAPPAAPTNLRIVS